MKKKEGNQKNILGKNIKNTNLNFLSKGNRAQEEMIGFGVILLLVAIVLVVFLSLSMGGSDKKAVDSYQVNSFLQAYLQYNSKCQEKNYGIIENVSMQNLIKKCYKEENCLDERDPCELLNKTSKDMIVESWQIKEGSPRVGYEFIVADSENNLIAYSSEGKETYDSRGGRQPLGISGENLMIDLTIYFNQTTT